MTAQRMSTKLHISNIGNSLFCNISYSDLEEEPINCYTYQRTTFLSLTALKYNPYTCSLSLKMLLCVERVQQVMLPQTLSSYIL